MNPNDFQTFPIREPNPNESETNPNLRYNLCQSMTLIRLNPKSIRTTFNPFQSVARIRMNPNQAEHTFQSERSTRKNPSLNRKDFLILLDTFQSVSLLKFQSKCIRHQPNKSD